MLSSGWLSLGEQQNLYYISI